MQQVHITPIEFATCAQEDYGTFVGNTTNLAGLLTLFPTQGTWAMLYHIAFLVMLCYILGNIAVYILYPIESTPAWLLRKLGLALYFSFVKKSLAEVKVVAMKGAKQAKKKVLEAATKIKGDATKVFSDIKNGVGGFLVSHPYFSSGSALIAFAGLLMFYKHRVKKMIQKVVYGERLEESKMSKDVTLKLFRLITGSAVLVGGAAVLFDFHAIRDLVNILKDISVVRSAATFAGGVGIELVSILKSCLSATGLLEVFPGLKKVFKGAKHVDRLLDPLDAECDPDLIERLVKERQKNADVSPKKLAKIVEATLDAREKRRLRLKRQKRDKGKEKSPVSSSTSSDEIEDDAPGYTAKQLQTVRLEAFNRGVKTGENKARQEYDQVSVAGSASTSVPRAGVKSSTSDSESDSEHLIVEAVQQMRKSTNSRSESEQDFIDWIRYESELAKGNPTDVYHAGWLRHSMKINRHIDAARQEHLLEIVLDPHDPETPIEYFDSSEYNSGETWDEYDIEEWIAGAQKHGKKKEWEKMPEAKLNEYVTIRVPKHHGGGSRRVTRRKYYKLKERGFFVESSTKKFQHFLAILVVFAVFAIAAYYLFVKVWKKTPKNSYGKLGKKKQKKEQTIRVAFGDNLSEVDSDCAWETKDSRGKSKRGRGSRNVHTNSRNFRRAPRALTPEEYDDWRDKRQMMIEDYNAEWDAWIDDMKLGRTDYDDEPVLGKYAADDYYWDFVDPGYESTLPLQVKSDAAVENTATKPVLKVLDKPAAPKPKKKKTVRGKKVSKGKMPGISHHQESLIPSSPVPPMIIDRSRHSVVSSYKDGKANAVGNAFFVGNVVLTAKHVISGGGDKHTITVVSEGESREHILSFKPLPKGPGIPEDLDLVWAHRPASTSVKPYKMAKAKSGDEVWLVGLDVDEPQRRELWKTYGSLIPLEAPFQKVSGSLCHTASSQCGLSGSAMMSNNGVIVGVHVMGTADKASRANCCVIFTQPMVDFFGQPGAKNTP